MLRIGFYILPRQLSLYYIVFTLIFYINDLVYMRNRCLAENDVFLSIDVLIFPTNDTVNTIITCNYFMVINPLNASALPGLHKENPRPVRGGQNTWGSECSEGPGNLGQMFISCPIALCLT